MLKITNYKTYQKEDGTEFYALVVQGGIEAVTSQETNRTYLTIREAKVACTFNEDMCKAAIGTELEGRIERVETEPYQYTNQDTGEVMTLTHRNEFITEQEGILRNNVIKSEVVV